MSTKNTSVVPGVAVGTTLATGEQIEHIMDMWRRRLKGRDVTLAEANHIIQNGGQYLPVMDKAADVLVDQVRSDMQSTIVRMVRNVRRNRTAVQAINDTGRVQYVDSSVVATMPTGDGPEDVELTYFRASRYLSDDELELEFGSRELVPDPQAQAADNEADSAFADEHPNGTHWKNKKGQWCFASFDQDVVERLVHVCRFGNRWHDIWWLPFGF